MNKRMKLSLAVALALGSADVFALGLGTIQVKSGLNQPLVAEIPVSGTPAETAGLNVALAADDAFTRVGLSRARLPAQLEFAVVPGGKSGAVIRVTTAEPVKEPFLDFLIEVNWGKGKLLREYAVLLDPPVTAPASKGPATTAPVREPATETAATAEPLPEPARTERPAKSESRPAETKPATTDSRLAAEPKPAARAAARGAASGEYGPVGSGETLWEIASATRPDADVSLDQMMLALLRANPSAFYQANINTLKRGAILRIPGSDEIHAAGSAAAAAAEVRNQNAVWRGVAAKPTLVADTTPAATPAKAEPTAGVTKPADHLELVPPKAGKGQSGADRAGAGNAAAGDSTALKAELARAKEALTSKEQESGELKSRVKELEALQAKNEKLLSLKDSELAELQRKLKELQDKAAVASTVPAKPADAKAAETKPADAKATSAKANAKVAEAKPADAKSGLTKDEIWGSASGEGKPAATTATAPNAGATAAAGSATPPPPGTTPPTVTSGDAGKSTTTPAATPALADAKPEAKPESKPDAAASKPTAVPPKPPTKVQPLPPEEPWYLKPVVLGGAGAGALALLVIGIIAGLRRGKKPAAKLPVAEEPAEMADAGAFGADEEHALLQRLAEHPDDTGAHLELVSLYYARGDAEKFEGAAEAMYAHIGDAEQAEWAQVQAMGRELAPHHPLFDSAAPAAQESEVALAEPAFGAEPPAAPAAHADDHIDFGSFEDAASMAVPPPAQPADDLPPFDFDLTEPSARPPIAPVEPPVAAAEPVAELAPAAPAAKDEFTLDLPAFDFDTEIKAPRIDLPEPAAVPAAVPVEDDLTADATGTKLDLARAYLDMGDPEGARFMLEEVLAEGNEAQKTEARKLLADIH